MKKVFRLLLLGFLTVTVLSPSIVTAAEDQNVQELSSSVYSKVDGITPLATPFIDEVTLEHGESYDLKRNIILSRELDFPHGLIKIETASGVKEAFSISTISSLPGYSPVSEPIYYFDTHYYYRGWPTTHFTEKPEVFYWGRRITNYSAGSVTFKVGMNVVYGPDYDLDFDL